VSLSRAGNASSLRNSSRRLNLARLASQPLLVRSRLALRNQLEVFSNSPRAYLAAFALELVNHLLLLDCQPSSLLPLPCFGGQAPVAPRRLQTPFVRNASSEGTTATSARRQHKNVHMPHGPHGRNSFSTQNSSQSSPPRCLRTSSAKRVSQTRY
jgi:hypothetical protein